MQAQYFFMTSLPSLPPLGEAPPVGLGHLHERASDMGGVREVVDGVLLEHDLMQRQAVLSGEREEVEPVVLTREQVLGEAPLPEYLRGHEQIARAVGDDAMWEAYFRHLAAEAGRAGCPFLRLWVGFEVALRNALVVARAKALEMTADQYIVAAELGDDQADVGQIVAQWSAAENPLVAQRTLDQGRWDWLAGHGGWFSFRIDETAAYARGLVLLHRWHDMKTE